MTRHHGCHQKAIELLGIGSDNLRRVAHDEALRMKPGALDEAIRRERDIRLAKRLADRVRAADDLALWEPQSLSIVCFRYVPLDRSRDEDAIDALNKRLLERVQVGGQAFLSSTVLNGRFWLRACVVNPRACNADIDALVEIVRRAGRMGT